MSQPSDSGQQPVSPDMSVQREIVDVMAQNQKYHFYLNLAGMLIGAAFCAAGFVLAIMGVAGSIDWVLKGPDISSRLSNATPGALFAVLGAFVLWRYRPEVRDFARWDGTVTRFARGYTGTQLGQFITSDDLDAKRKPKPPAQNSK
jgi:hypothetical protein